MVRTGRYEVERRPEGENVSPEDVIRANFETYLSQDRQPARPYSARRAAGPGMDGLRSLGGLASAVGRPRPAPSPLPPRGADDLGIFVLVRHR